MTDPLPQIDPNDLRRLPGLPLLELASMANRIREDELGRGLDICSIANVKSGTCGEDCRFCAQSSHYLTGTASYPLMGSDDIIRAAERAKEVGAARFGIVASGKKVTGRELDRIAGDIDKINRETGIKTCASLGVLNRASLKLLKDSGLSRYHHNLETSRSYFPEICTTHSFDDRISTVKAAKEAGLEVCSGGIIGAGENWQDRIDMALSLKELDVDAVPVNILIPIKNTPLENREPISCADAVKTIAIFRIILRNKTVKIAAGRESALKDFQGLAFMSGANGMIVDGYLTVRGRDITEDRKLIDEIQKSWQSG